MLCPTWIIFWFLSCLLTQIRNKVLSSMLSCGEVNWGMLASSEGAMEEKQTHTQLCQDWAVVIWAIWPWRILWFSAGWGGISPFRTGTQIWAFSRIHSFFLKKQVAAVARKAFTYIHLACQLCPLLNQEAIQSVTHALITFIRMIAMGSRYRCSLKSFGNFSWFRMQWPQALIGSPLLKNVWAALIVG